MTQTARQTGVIFLSIVIAAAIGVPTVGAAPPDPTVRVEPATLEVHPGEDFEVQVMIDDVEDLGGFELTVAYDPSVIELKDAAAGDFLGSTGRMAIPLGPQIDAEAGTAALGAAAIGESAGPDGTGLLATLTGTALTAGSSSLRLEKVHVFNTANEPLSVEAADGEIVVNGADTEPAESADPADPPARTTPWGWIVAGALLVVGAAAAVAFAVLRGRPQKGPEMD